MRLRLQETVDSGRVEVKMADGSIRLFERAEEPFEVEEEEGSLLLATGYFVERPTVLLRIRRRASEGEGGKIIDTTPPRVSLSHAHIRGRYEISDEPFEVEEEEARVMLRSGEFEPAPEAAPSPAARSANRRAAARVPSVEPGPDTATATQVVTAVPTAPES